MTNNKNIRVRSFQKSNKQVNIPQKLTRVPGCVRIMGRILTNRPKHALLSKHEEDTVFASHDRYHCTLMDMAPT